MVTDRLKLCRSNFDIRRGRISVEWFIGAETNMCYNAVDRHVAAGQGNRVAFFCEGNSPEDTRTITYRQLQAMVCKVANYLRSVGVKKGDNVSIYMPMVPELPAAMVKSCHLLFGLFGPHLMRYRTDDLL